MTGKFYPGDIVKVSGKGLSALQDINGTYNESAIGSILFRNKTGIVIGNTNDGWYKVDFGLFRNGCVFILEKWLVRA